MDERYRYEDVIGTNYRLGALFKPNQGKKPKSKVHWHSRITRKNPATGKWEKATPYKQSGGSTDKNEAKRKLWKWCVEQHQRDENLVVARTFEDAAEEWIEDFKKQVELEKTRKSTTLTNYRSTIKLLNSAKLERRRTTLGQLNLCDLRMSDITDLQRSDAYLKSSRGERTLSSKQQILKCLKSFLTWCAARDDGRYIAKVPSFNVLPGGKPRKRKAVRLELTDLMNLFHRIQMKVDFEGLPVENLWILCLLLIRTPLRKNCCLRLRWNQHSTEGWVDLQNGWIVVPEGFTKRGVPFSFPLCDELWKILTLAYEDRPKDEYVLANMRTRNDIPRSWYGIFRECLTSESLDTADVENFRLHDLRSVLITQLDEAVIEEEEGGRIIHKSIPESYKRLLADHTPGSDEHVGYRTLDHEHKLRRYINALPALFDREVLPEWLGAEILRDVKVGVGSTEETTAYDTSELESMNTFDAHFPVETDT